ncbi:hypothetical protein [Tritonibacter mobilis]|uniref:hypothetical protein n=1 Tax=Tritonibacter mobilis TaxID=379347 RepID=UPI001403E7F8|nr:hypothetical protein [Tritonibacter mobilis]NHM20530.1 hypothetical protein [Tritonibacter mobilis]NHM24692.1 hypothetical protein [Tritonibacter mobilis]
MAIFSIFQYLRNVLRFNVSGLTMWWCGGSEDQLWNYPQTFSPNTPCAMKPKVCVGNPRSAWTCREAPLAVLMPHKATSENEREAVLKQLAAGAQEQDMGYGSK